MLIHEFVECKEFFNQDPATTKLRAWLGVRKSHIKKVRFDVTLIPNAVHDERWIYMPWIPDRTVFYKWLYAQPEYDKWNVRSKTLIGYKHPVPEVLYIQTLPLLNS